jgi:hypothetical protein
VIRIMSVTAEPTCDGETCGRAVMSDALRASDAGRGNGATILAGAAAWGNAELAMGSLWLRGYILEQGPALGVDPLEIVSRPDTSHVQARAWELQHHYLAGMAPYVLGGTEICCRSCLLTLTAALASTAGFLLALAFGRDWGCAYAYILDGAPLPVVPVASPA